jgi:hypothetical protein
MMRIIRLIGLTAFALCVFAAMAGSASACELLTSPPTRPAFGPFENEQLCLEKRPRGQGDWYELVPVFLTESGKALLFTATSSLGTLRGPVGAEVHCEKDSVHGFVLDESPLAREVEVEFKGKCEQTTGGVKATCNEPIKTEKLFGELGLLNGHVLVLFAPEVGNKFVTITCGVNNTEVEGALVGEFKLNTEENKPQYGVLLKLGLILFKAENAKEKQVLKELELLGSLMTGVTLKTAGFFAGEASEETSELVHADGNVQIDP